jgi:hypothetical protein
MERGLSAASVKRLNWQSAQRARVRVHSSGYIVIVIGRYSNSSKCENRGDRGQNIFPLRFLLDIDIPPVGVVAVEG